MSCACPYCKLVHGTEYQIVWCDQNRAVCRACKDTGIVTWDNYSYLHGQTYCEFRCKWLLHTDREALQVDFAIDAPPSSPQEDMSDFTSAYSSLSLDK
jgi:hypothetical protein